MIDIFKINIIIIEVQYENDINKSSVKCPNINRKTGLFDKNINKYCLLFKFKNTYQPLVIFNKNSAKTFKILFNINESSKSNIEKLYNKCLLKYNDTLYNNVIINSVYNNINIDNFIILSDNDLIDLINQNLIIKYVIDFNFYKLGILLSNNKEELFIPINNLKHNVHFLIK